MLALLPRSGTEMSILGVLAHGLIDKDFYDQHFFDS